VAEGQLSASIGLWWVHGVFLIVGLLLYQDFQFNGRKVARS